MALFQKSVLNNHLNHLDDGHAAQKQNPQRFINRTKGTYKVQKTTLLLHQQIDQMVYGLYKLIDVSVGLRVGLIEGT
jgi:hypothetical protein